ncbi:LD-carboxypeptidase [Marivirga sp. S37H4]|uniref:LD-carboxypeptidase n=1 Tax=Marivirga aurantiaca TaxID=2802615 RepID=A0A935CB91_9BACT|nr:LD-carboxypeptidase [Marivirga aurantiaca]MBK6267025.1 LD-carboxypeptidase [Marivirga aurantiaca]
MIQHPPFLQTDDLIIIVSPSGVVQEDLVRGGAEILQGAGFTVEFAPHVFSKHFKFAGTNQQRLSDLQYALDHSNAKAIYCARGGFGITHILDHIDWTLFKQNPKWIIGYSDITALHHAAYLTGFTSIHTSVLQGLSELSIENQQAILGALKGHSIKMSAKSNFNKSGESTGELVGGNLSLLVHQIGTGSDIDYSGKILFIEEVGEPLYHVDRMLLQLARAGKLKGLKGLLVGEFFQMTETKELFGASVEEIIFQHCSIYDFPIGFNFPVGHGEQNWPLVHGANVQLKVSGNSAQLNYLS